MKVKIIQASGQHYWYREAIGGVFEVEPHKYNAELWAIINNPPREGFNIHKTDTEVIEADTPPPTGGRGAETVDVGELQARITYLERELGRLKRHCSAQDEGDPDCICGIIDGILAHK